MSMYTYPTDKIFQMAWNSVHIKSNRFRVPTCSYKTKEYIYGNKKGFMWSITTLRAEPEDKGV